MALYYLGSFVLLSESFDTFLTAILLARTFMYLLLHYQMRRRESWGIGTTSRLLGNAGKRTLAAPEIVLGLCLKTFYAFAHATAGSEVAISRVSDQVGPYFGLVTSSYSDKAFFFSLATERRARLFVSASIVILVPVPHLFDISSLGEYRSFEAGRSQNGSGLRLLNTL
ncbi:hypothetical protein R3P38DRAFT_2775568 [Favolaschia claudopus]|uniref:Uncharacterized protein n=1 Tax=Favolaschia claudopus TaxID=2862362 RepID=A0AAW0BV85_9AGAR